jgi:hypothetical protein
MRHSSASWSTLRAPNLLLSAHSFPTLDYFSSCSSGCSPCAVVRLLWDARSGSRCGGDSSCWPWYSQIHLCSKGSDLALACHCRRGPLDGMSGYSFPPFLYAHQYFISQVLMILNLNGNFSFTPIRQRGVLIELYSGETIRASQPRTSLFASSGVI